MKHLRFFLLFVFSLYAAVVFLKLRFSCFSGSMPPGIYREVSGTAKIGMIATTCLNKSIADYGLARGYFMKGDCPSGIRPVMKQIYALPGDTVDSEGNEVLINGRQTGIMILKNDSNGRVLSRRILKNYRLKSDEYFLMSEYKANSFDSRYWGPVTVEDLLAPVISFR